MESALIGARRNMKREPLKSFGAVIAGFAALAVLSTVTDSVLEKTGIMKTHPFIENPVWLIASVILYRTTFNTFGCYLAARLAPSKPMRHAMILGIICALLTLVGLILMWEVPPRWYPGALIVLTLPAAWIGGKLAMAQLRRSADARESVRSCSSET